jgi:hypothetical protein
MITYRPVGYAPVELAPDVHLIRQACAAAGDVQTVRPVRGMAAEHLAATPPPRLDAALLVASELANNVVLHGRTPTSSPCTSATC